jgi:hypothetical protein
MTPAERHLTYLYLLGQLPLGESLARQVAQAWYGYEQPEMAFEFRGRRWASDVYARVAFDLIRAVPSPVRNVIVCDAMKDRFQLEGVAGFYFDKIWRLNLDPTRAAIVKPYRNMDGLIQGLLVYSHLNDNEPRLLTSRYLPKGTKAEPYYPERMAA